MNLDVLKTAVGTTFNAYKLYFILGFLAVYTVFAGWGGYKLGHYIGGYEGEKVQVECTAKDLRAAQDALAGEVAARSAEANAREMEIQNLSIVAENAKAIMEDYQKTNQVLAAKLAAQESTVAKLKQENANVRAQLDAPYDPALIDSLRAKVSGSPTQPAKDRKGH